MTLKQIKEDLPQVQIIFAGKQYTGGLSGRKNKFACVWIQEFQVQFEFSWAAIERAVNEGHILRA